MSSLRELVEASSSLSRSSKPPMVSFSASGTMSLKGFPCAGAPVARREIGVAGADTNSSFACGKPAEGVPGADPAYDPISSVVSKKSLSESFSPPSETSPQTPLASPQKLRPASLQGDSGTDFGEAGTEGRFWLPTLR